MRVCHCVGYMNNPGGVCCRDLYARPYRYPPEPYVPVSPSPAPPIPGPLPLIDPEVLRRIVREEIERVQGEQKDAA